MIQAGLPSLIAPGSDAVDFSLPDAIPQSRRSWQKSRKCPTLAALQQFVAKRILLAPPRVFADRIQPVLGFNGA